MSEFETKYLAHHVQVEWSRAAIQRMRFRLAMLTRYDDDAPLTAAESFHRRRMMRMYLEAGVYPTASELHDINAMSADDLRALLAHVGGAFDE